MYARLYREIAHIVLAVFAIQVALLIAVAIWWLMDYAFAAGGA